MLFVLIDACAPLLPNKTRFFNSIHTRSANSKMSFAHPKTIIEEGDTVILYLTASNMHAIEVCAQIKNKKGSLVENVFQTSFGALKVFSLIGHSYGSKVNIAI